MRANRRALLIQAGMDLFSRYGYRDVSIEDVVKQCGLGVGTFYRYFSSKESFYEHILSIIEREGIRKAERMISRLHSPMNKLKAVYRFIVLGVRHYPILRGVLLRDPRYLYPGIDLRDGAVGGLRGHIEHMVDEIIREGTRRGVFRTGLYRNTARLVISMMDTLILNLDDPAVDELTQDTLVLLQRGLRRVLRLRNRDERRDRRMMRGEEEIDWIE